MSKQDVGKLCEKKAADFLKKKGYRVRETNYRCRTGEIDIVAQDKDQLVFVEVRARTVPGLVSPEESISTAKQQKMISAGLTYLQTHKDLPGGWRFDVVAMDLDGEGRVIRTELIRDAV